MQLRNARVCLDCEEIHESNECPVCASESYAFVARWVPAANERPARQRPPSPPVAAEAQSAAARWMKRGAAGLAVLAVSRWLWHTTRERDES